MIDFMVTLKKVTMALGSCAAVVLHHTMAAITNGTTKELTEVWTMDELMGNGAAPFSSDQTTLVQQERRKSSFRRANKDKVEPADWGRPGHLTQEEADVYVSD